LNFSSLFTVCNPLAREATLLPVTPPKSEEVGVQRSSVGNGRQQALSMMRMRMNGSFKEADLPVLPVVI
jgi:hypothetical protein